MDGFVRLFCGCCGMSGDPEPPYSQLRDDSVTPVRDPPLQQRHQQTGNGAHQQQHHYHDVAHQYQNQQYQTPEEPLQEQGFINPVHNYFSVLDAVDGADDPYSNSASPPLGDLDDDAEDDIREKEQLDHIVENTQHSIIAVGQTDVEGFIVMDTQYREQAYRQKTLKMTTAQPSVARHDNVYDFHFEPTQPPIPVPVKYDQVSSTIAKKPAERMPFSCPDFKQLKVARTMGEKNPNFLTEHPDLKAAGRTPSISSGAKGKITDALDEIHAGIVGIEVEPRDLIVHMDF